MKIITPQIKDRILIDLISMDEDFLEVNYENEGDKYEISSTHYEMVIRQFIKMELLQSAGGFWGGVHIRVNADAHDFISHCGFQGQEEILKANIEKLSNELESLSKELSPNYLEKAQSISSIANNIASFLKISEFFS